MADIQFFQNLGTIIIAAAVLVMLGRAVRMPAIVVYLLAGVLIGPLLGWVEMSPKLEMISEKGIALLLFLVGLELSFDKIREVGKVAIIAGTGQVIFTAVGGFGISLLLGYNSVEAFFIGAGMTFSSTVIAVKLLDEKKEIGTHFGQIAVACSLVQSFLVILLLTVLSGIGGGEGAAAMVVGIAKAFGGILLLLVLVMAAARYLLPRVFAWVARYSEISVVWSLCWCLLMIAFARKLGLSLEIGSFLAGISLAQLPHNADLHRRIHPLMNLFMAIFFVSLGVMMNFGAISVSWLVPVALSAFVMIGNTFIYLVLIPRFGFSAKTALLTGITGAQISEFSFILAGMGVAIGMIGPGIVGLVTLIGVLTMSISAYLILHNHAIARMIEKTGMLGWFEAGKPESTKARTAELSGHVIVVGMNTLGREIVKRLHEKGEMVLAVDTDPRKLAGLPGRQLLGSVEYLSVLQEAGLERARLLVSALRIEETNDLLAYRCQAAGVPSAIQVVDMSVTDSLLDLGVDYLMIPKVDGVKAQLVKLREMEVLKP
jgi:Kef-type K+ transport system membrane component KefB